MWVGSECLSQIFRSGFEGKIIPVCGILVVKGKNTAMTGGVSTDKVKKKAKNPNYFSSDFAESGGDEGDRTLDLTDANRTLSQLSYAPAHWNVHYYSTGV